MSKVYTENDYEAVRELLRYPEFLDEHLSSFRDTSELTLPEDPIERVIDRKSTRLNSSH